LHRTTLTVERQCVLHVQSDSSASIGVWVSTKMAVPSDVIGIAISPSEVATHIGAPLSGSSFPVQLSHAHATDLDSTTCHPVLEACAMLHQPPRDECFRCVMASPCSHTAHCRHILHCFMLFRKEQHHIPFQCSSQPQNSSPVHMHRCGCQFQCGH